ncbi:MAG: hypothetical protein MZV64_73385 [Ignavibacteriales bacterium]|nr:hypothetical protein [Ignavibacteriales bacterium]
MPASSGLAGRREAAQAAALDQPHGTVRARACADVRRRAPRGTRIVERQSPPGASPRIVVRPVARAPRMRARCEIDLSPGHAKRPPKRRAGRTTRSTRRSHVCTIASARCSGLWYGESRSGRR